MSLVERRRWSWKIGQLFGIAIRVHVTLWMLFAWLIVVHALRGAGLVEVSLGVVLVASVFVLIVAHELGHALVARRFDCRTREILLLPIGGLSRLERMPERPAQELAVALAGPAVNVVLAIVLSIGMVITGASFDPARAATVGGGLVGQLLWIDIVLAIFNLLPAFPMDGGRVLRALLAIRLGRRRATQIAGRVGRVLAVGFILLGVLYNPMLVLIGAFVWLAGSQEAAAVELRSVLAGGTVERAMISQPVIVEAADSIEQAARTLLAAGHAQAAVVDHGKLAGIVLVDDVSEALAEAGAPRPVESIARLDIPVLGPDDQLDVVMPRLERAGAAYVVDHGQLVGLLTLDQLASYASLHAVR